MKSFNIDFAPAASSVTSQAPVVITSSSVDVSKSVPAGWYIVAVSAPCYINNGAAATSANALLPAGYFPTPVFLKAAAGATPVIHVLTVSGSASVTFIPVQAGSN
jgi:type IV secretory pathway protease TraF